MPYKNPPMKFNVGTKKYEPNLPTTKKGEKPNVSVWKIIFILLGIVAVAVLIYFLINL